MIDSRTMAKNRLPDIWIKPPTEDTAQAPPPSSEPAPEPVAAPAVIPAPPTGPFTLPFIYTIRAVRPGAQIEIDGAVVDAGGRSVQFLPLAVDGRSTTAEIEAIVQQTITQIAQVTHKRGEAIVPETAQEAVDLQSLVGRTFRGSVVK